MLSETSAQSYATLESREWGQGNAEARELPGKPEQGATSAAVWLAARNALAGASETVEIIHLLGATDGQISAVFQKTVLREAVFGAAVGTAIGIAAVLALGRQFAALDSGMTAGAGLMLADWLVIAAVPVAGVLLALVTARITIALALRAML